VRETGDRHWVRRFGLKSGNQREPEKERGTHIGEGGKDQKGTQPLSR
jgi:hypothetical protein